MREIQLKEINEDDESYKSNEQQLIKEEENFLGNELIEGKANEFKLRLIKQFKFFEEHFLLSAFLKLIFGIIILGLPFLCMIIFNAINFSDKNNFFFLPYFISISLIIGSLMILLVIKLGEGCQMYGIIIYSWERKNLFRIIESIIRGLHFLWFLFMCEKFIKAFNLLKEKVAQTNEKRSSSWLFNRGAYTLRILFILFFWDSEKNNEGKYIHEYLEYFDYEESVFSEFHSYIQSLLLPIIFLSFYNLFKIIFFKDGKQILFLVLSLLIIFQSFFIIFYPIDKRDDISNEDYFSNTNCKYIELIVYLLIILILMFWSFNQHILKLIRKKYFPKKSQGKKNIIIAILFSSFLINIIGYILIIVLIFSFTFENFNENLKISTYLYYWLIIDLSLLFIFLGYSFVFGHYYYNLIYYPISYEITPHYLKNEFYTKCSGKIIETEESGYKFSRKSFDGFFP